MFSETTKYIPVSLVFLVFTSVATFAQTFNGGDVENPDNWTGGLPTNPSSPGIIDTNGFFEILTNLYIVQESGVVGRIQGVNSQALSDGSYTLEGGLLTGRLSFIQDGASFTVNGGTHTMETNRDMEVNGAGGSGSSFTILSGSSSIGRDLEVFDGATFNISGGSLQVARDLGNRNFHDVADFNFNGGDTTAQFLSFGTASIMNFGGTTAGSVVVENFGGRRHNVNNIRLNFITGSLMSLELTNALESGVELGWSVIDNETGLDWAEALWADGRLTYNGEGFGTLGTWSTVNGSIFSFSDDTLSLVPETSSFSALSGLLVFTYILFRRRS